VTTLAVVVAAGSLVVRFRRARGTERLPASHVRMRLSSVCPETGSRRRYKDVEARSCAPAPLAEPTSDRPFAHASLTIVQVLDQRLDAGS